MPSAIVMSNGMIIGTTCNSLGVGNILSKTFVVVVFFWIYSLITTIKTKN